MSISLNSALENYSCYITIGLPLLLWRFSFLRKIGSIWVLFFFCSLLLGLFIFYLIFNSLSSPFLFLTLTLFLLPYNYLLNFYQIVKLCKCILYANSLVVMYLVTGVRLSRIKFRPLGAIYLPLYVSVSPFMRMRIMPFLHGCRKGSNELVNVNCLE